MNYISKLNKDNVPHNVIKYVEEQEVSILKMKPTEKQIKVIDTILSIIKTWNSTNDIDSPTHSSDIHDFLYANLESEDIIRHSITDELEDNLRSILYIIQIV